MAGMVTIEKIRTIEAFWTLSAPIGARILMTFQMTV